LTGINAPFFARFFVTALAIAALAIGGYYGWRKFGGKLTDDVRAAGTPFATQTVGGLTITLLHPQGQLRAASNEALIEFRNASGDLVDVGEVKLNLGMNMIGMVMHAGATITRTDTPGRKSPPTWQVTGQQACPLTARRAPARSASP
jgi:hypothetical protein